MSDIEESEPPAPVFHCIVCHAAYGPNPRTARWLTGKAPAAIATRANLCWVCARLAASAADEAREMASTFNMGSYEGI